ncbi:MAG: septum site-determining protein MinC [Alphaproteobacteria bacterium]|nr:septum site-determining protein MinC [Alphaproteobacteria bacterium]
MSIAAAVEVPELGGVLDLSAVDGVLVVTLDAKASFEALRVAVRETFSATPDRFRGRDARLDLGDRGIDLFDLRRLVHVLKEEFGVSVTGVYCTEESLLRFAERELKLRIYARRPEADAPAIAPEDAPALPVVESEPPPAAPSVEPDAPVTEAAQKVITIDRGLRSGQQVRFSGDVLVFGDVNPGAEVVAGGNIVVFGALKGMVHAGSVGDDNAVIMAFEMRPTQLRIGRHIAFPTGSPDRATSRNGYSPEIAWVDRGEIVIEAYQGRLPR